MVDSKYFVGDRKARSPSCKLESVDQKTLECKQEEKNTERTIGKNIERKMQKQQSTKTMIERASENEMKNNKKWWCNMKV